MHSSSWTQFLVLFGSCSFICPYTIFVSCETTSPLGLLAFMASWSSPIRDHLPFHLFLSLIHFSLLGIVFVPTRVPTLVPRLTPLFHWAPYNHKNTRLGHKLGHNMFIYHYKKKSLQPSHHNCKTQEWLLLMTSSKPFSCLWHYLTHGRHLWSHCLITSMLHWWGKGLYLERRDKRKANGESSCSTDIAHWRSNTESNIDERNRSKIKGKFDITYCDCVRKCPKKPICRNFRKELECKRVQMTKWMLKRQIWIIQISSKGKESQFGL